MRTQDAAGNLITETDARGVVATYQYDALNRVTSVTFAPPAGSTIAPATLAYGYDQGTYGLGHLTGITDPSGTSAYVYNQKGRLVQELRTIAGVTYTTSYSYDTFGRLTGVTYPSGRAVLYSFDATGRIKQIDTTYQGTSQAIVSNVTYQPFGSVTGWTFGNAQGYARSYDLDGRVSGYTLGNFSRSVVTDDASRIIGYTHANPVLNQSFGYDNVNRLTNWSTASTGQSFDYDLTGNRVSQVIGANTYAYLYPGYGNRKLQSVDGPTARSYQYDAAGNTINDGRSFTYDARARLVSAQNGNMKADYVLNALGQRVEKSIAGAETTVFHYDAPGHLIGESDAAGNVRKEYVWLGDTPVAVITVAAPQAASCPAVPSVNSGAGFIAFSDTERLEVKGGKSGSGDWEWALGSNTQASGQFVSSNLTWTSKKTYSWTLSYDGKGSGTYTVFDGSKKLFSKTFKGSGTKLLHTGNAIELRVRSSAGIPTGNAIAVALTNVNGTAFNQKLATPGDGSASEQKLFVAGTSLASKVTVQGTVSLTFTGKRPPLGASLDFLVNAGNVTCNQPTQAKADIAYIQTDQIDTPRTVTDATRKVIWQWDDLDPFGANMPIEDPDGDGTRFTLNLRFAGQYFDRETGLHQNYFRDYDPSTGRYVESDPIGLSGGIDLYGYAAGNPSSYADPRGLIRWKGDMYSVVFTALGGGGQFYFDLKSQCVDGKYAYIRVYASALLGSLGAKYTGGWSSISFEDYRTDIYPEGFQGTFKIVSAGVGAILTGAWTSVKLGANTADFSFGPSPGIGVDLSVAAGLGKSMVVAREFKECGCNR